MPTYCLCEVWARSWPTYINNRHLKLLIVAPQKRALALPITENSPNAVPFSWISSERRPPFLNPEPTTFHFPGSWTNAIPLFWILNQQRPIFLELNERRPIFLDPERIPSHVLDSERITSHFFFPGSRTRSWAQNDLGCRRAPKPQQTNKQTRTRSPVAAWLR